MRMRMRMRMRMDNLPRSTSELKSVEEAWKEQAERASPDDVARGSMALTATCIQVPYG
jgi:hypothetical protein